jgi:hypothetical protein
MRHRGIASAALQEAAAIAVRAQVKGLYIDCLAVTAPVYEKNGWRVYEREVGDKDSVVMLRTIEDRSRRAEHGAPLNGGPAIRPDTSGVSGGPPSVS